MAEPAFKLTADTSDARRKFDSFSRATKTRVAKIAFKELHGYWATQTGRLFKTAGKSTGGSYRGETWKGFAPQYTRKTDGVRVPAWGGVKRLHGGGSVKGKKRPSGSRVTKSSKLMQDTGLMFRSIITRPASVTARRLRIGTKGQAQKYAPYQNAMRQFMFWRAPQDARVGGRIFSRRINEQAARSGLR